MRTKNTKQGRKKMMMTFEEFETVPGRTLSVSQERRLLHKHCCGDFGPGVYATVQSLIVSGYAEETGKDLVLTEKAAHYIYHHKSEMPV